MNILFHNNIIVNKNYISPKQASVKPDIILENLNTNAYYTLIMNDIDVQINNRKFNKVHWCIVNIKGNNIHSGIELLEYQGPNPPKDSGTHHYIFTLYEQNQLTNTEIVFEKGMLEQDILLDILGLRDKKPIYTNYFVSSYQEGGKSKPKKNKSRKTKSRKTKLNKNKSKKNRK